MNATLRHACKAIHFVPIALVLILCNDAIADDEEEYRGLVIGFTELDCDGHAKLFESKNRLQTGDVLYWSWHPVDDELNCQNLKMEEMRVTGRRLQQVFFGTLVTPSALRVIPIKTTRWHDGAWGRAMRKAMNCWKEKARAKNVDFVDTEYKTVLDWNLGAQGLTNISFENGSPTFKGIHINPGVIAREAGRYGHWFYTDFVYTLIHETIHAERFHSDKYLRNSILEERKVQEEAFKRYRAIYGSDIEPPFTFRTEDEMNALLASSGWDDMKAEYDRLEGSTDPDDMERRDELYEDLRPLTQELMRGIPNDNYDKDKDKIDSC